MKLQHYELTDVGLTRSENQDSIFSLPEHGVFMVADGMGGERAGAEASAQVVATVRRMSKDFFESNRNHNPRNVGQMVVSSLQKANEEVFELSIEDPLKTGLGSTGSLLCLQHGLYFAGQVGDSRIYLVRDGEVRQVTRDHSIVWELYENNIITREQLETHPERHLLTQCIGSNKPIQVDLFEEKVAVGDLFLISSDGLTGYAGEDAVIQTLLEPALTMEERTHKLLQSALEGGGGDNVSIILIEVVSLDSQDNWEPVLDTEESQETSSPTLLLPDPPGEVEAPAPPSKKNNNLLYIGGALLIVGVVALVAVLLFKS